MNYSVMPSTILNAAINVEPQKTLFKDTFVSGRRLADIDNNGSVVSADSLSYQRYMLNPSLNPAARNEYIATVLNPYMIANPVAYAAYLIFT